MLEIRDTISGAVGAFFCVYAGLPFDVAKVRLQTQGTQSVLYSGPVQCLVKMARSEGISSLWKGAIPALASSGIENAVLFTANGAIQRVVLLRSQQEQLDNLTMACIGALSGFFSATAITPPEVIKCRLQRQHGKTVFRSPLDCVVKTIHQEGFRGLFRGLPAVWLRDIPFNFFFFGSYEFYSSTIRTALDKSPGEDLSAPLVLVAGGLAGVTGWSVVFPMDVIKSYMQTSTSTTTFGATSRSIFQTKGLIGFYRGWSAAVLRAFPANGSLFLGYELCNRAFCWLDGN